MKIIIIVLFMISSYIYYISDTSILENTIEGINTTFKSYNEQFEKTSGEQHITEHVQDKLFEVISDKANQTISRAKISIFTELTTIEETQSLIDNGFTYQEILKLKVISELSNTSIDDLIYTEGVVTELPDGQKCVNLEIVQLLYDITSDDINPLINKYKEKIFDSFDLSFEGIFD